MAVDVKWTDEKRFKSLEPFHRVYPSDSDLSQLKTDLALIFPEKVPNGFKMEVSIQATLIEE